MPYGYIGQNLPNQTKANSGVFSISDVADLEKQGKFGGSLELIEETTVTSAQNVDFTNIKQNKYNVHLLQVSNHTFPAGSQEYGIRFFESGVLETASVYQYARQQCGIGGSFFESKSTSSTYIRIDQTSSEQWVNQWYCYLYNLGNSSKYSFLTYHKVPKRLTVGGSYNSSGTYIEFGGGVLTQASEVDGIRVYNSSQTASAGNIKLYGVKQI